MTLSPIELRVLRVLAFVEDPEFGYRAFAPIMRATRLPRAIVRRACRSLTRKGLAEYAHGLLSYSGEFAGAGYAATEDGRRVARRKQ